MWARLSPKGEGWGEGEGDADQNRPGEPPWLRRFAATLRLADSPALRREAAQPTPEITHQKDTRHPDKFKPGLDRCDPQVYLFDHRSAPLSRANKRITHQTPSCHSQANPELEAALHFFIFFLRLWLV